MKRVKNLVSLVLIFFVLFVINIDSEAKKPITEDTEDTVSNNTVSNDTLSDNSVSDNEISEDDDKNADNNCSKYELYVNRALNCITVYENDEAGTRKAIKAFACSCGKANGHNTPRGTYATTEYYRWRKMIDGSYAQYAVRFNDLIMFHSVPYDDMDPSTLKWSQYNKLGEKASLGCVRLAVSDVKWIYDNCEEGTVVVVYDDENEKLPIAKPKTVHITFNTEFRNWDPTDPDKNNPWKKYSKDSI